MKPAPNEVLVAVRRRSHCDRARAPERRVDAASRATPELPLGITAGRRDAQARSSVEGHFADRSGSGREHPLDGGVGGNRTRVQGFAVESSEQRSAWSEPISSRPESAMGISRGTASRRMARLRGQCECMLPVFDRTRCRAGVSPRMIREVISGEEATMTTAQLVREARRATGLSQRVLADRAGIHQPALADIERGAHDTRGAQLRSSRHCGRPHASRCFRRGPVGCRLGRSSSTTKFCGRRGEARKWPSARSSASAMKFRGTSRSPFGSRSV